MNNTNLYTDQPKVLKFSELLLGRLYRDQDGDVCVAVVIGGTKGVAYPDDEAFGIMPELDGFEFTEVTYDDAIETLIVA